MHVFSSVLNLFIYSFFLSFLHYFFLFGGAVEGS